MSPPRLLRVIASAAVLLATAACTHVSLHQPAPVEQRQVGKVPAAASAPASAASAESSAAAAEVKPQPGFYTVKPGDSLLRIAFDNGQNWRDIVRWNNIGNPDRIEVGQVLRVVPPTADAGAVSTKPVAMARSDAPRPLDVKPDSRPVPSPVASAPAAASSPAASAPRGDDELPWSWPAAGPVIAGFDDPRNKGLDLGGKAGDPVYAAADGRVVYVGNDLRGFGNLVIIKHNDTYLSAYAHNQTLLVKDLQVVRKGQRIAEMGSTDSDQVKLHFEVRKQGKPIDPARVLPNR